MGFTKVDHDILEALYMLRLNARQLRTVLFILRESTGRGKTAWRVDIRRLAVAMDEYKGVANDTLYSLERMGILVIADGLAYVNSNTSEWSTEHVKCNEKPTGEQPESNRGATGEQQFVADTGLNPSSDAGFRPPYRQETRDKRQDKENPLTPLSGGGGSPSEVSTKGVEHGLSMIVSKALPDSQSERPQGQSSRLARGSAKIDYPEWFEAWFKRSPFQDKKQTWQAIAKLGAPSEDFIRDIGAGLDRWLASDQWRKPDPYICHGQTWVNGERWTWNPPPWKPQGSAAVASASASVLKTGTPPEEAAKKYGGW